MTGRVSAHEHRECVFTAYSKESRNHEQAHFPFPYERVLYQRAILTETNFGCGIKKKEEEET